MTSGCGWTCRYDGTDFSGWAVQPGRRTVAGVLVEALGRLVGAEPPLGLTVAGRTDAGVHATGQVCHVDLPDAALGRRWRGSLVRRLAALLPPDARVRAVTAGAGRRSTPGSRRRSGGTSTGSPTPRAAPEPLRRHDTLAWPRPLDLDRLQRGRGRAGRRARLRRVLQAQGARHHGPGDHPAGLAPRPGRRARGHRAGRRVLPGDGAQPGRRDAGRRATAAAPPDWPAGAADRCGNGPAR